MSKCQHTDKQHNELLDRRSGADVIMCLDRQAEWEDGCLGDFLIKISSELDVPLSAEEKAYSGLSKFQFPQKS